MGVSLAKEIKTQDWSFRPAVDFTVSTSFGDKEVDSVMVFNGVQGADINYMTEVADTFTYSLSVGADIYPAENGFSLGLSSGYTISSHTEDYGLNTNLNYVF